eukprot:CAMPEP_0195141714 /NCGR_PEP_ID=MMETSP0448-20130528/163437_1 /TAXON_ID=66468 /ORGANISM="Heterocapsa triquestra, Strain CCMP 448" /LENGTH=78 /DNA_ID=CAMNT_0040180103 /DNA_START=6 /DNA_END=239 /DNA_ORIENTATION=+
MHEVFAAAWLPGHAQLTPPLVCDPTEGVLVSLHWLGGTQDSATESLPWQSLPVPLDTEPIHGVALLDKHVPHAHVEAV